MSDYDAIVVGAGLAGLYAALELQKAGLKVVVVEARDRVGGLTYSPSSTVLGVRLDLGGQWVSDRHVRMLDLIARYGVPIVPQFVRGQRVRLHGPDAFLGAMGCIPGLDTQELEEQRQNLERLCGAIDRIAPDPCRSAEAEPLDAMTFSTWADAEAKSASIKGWFKRMTSSYYGAPANEISALDALTKIKRAGGPIFQAGVGEGAQKYHLNGSALISEGMAAELDAVMLSSPVREVKWTRDRVEVRASGKTLCGRFLICAISPVLLSQVAFDPPLPSSLRQLHQRFPSGRYTKLNLVYEKAFWRDEGLSGNAFATDGSFGSTYDLGDDSPDRPVLAVLLGGVTARGFDPLPADARRDRILGLLARAFGEKIRAPIEYREQIWADEQWSGGGSCPYTTPGALTAAGAVFNRPCGPIHWAGSHLSNESPGYMEGALISGEHVARNILGR